MANAPHDRLAGNEAQRNCQSELMRLLSYFWRNSIVTSGASSQFTGFISVTHDDAGRELL